MRSDHDRTAGVHRSLLVRMAVASAIVASLIGAIAYLLEQRALGDRIVERTRLGTELLKSEFRRILESGDAEPGKAAQLALDRLAGVLPESDFGHFELVEILDGKRRPIASLGDTDERLTEQLPRKFPENGTNLGELVRIAGTNFVPVSAAISDPDGVTVAYLSGLFLPSPQALSALRAGVWRSVGLAIAVVLLTTIALYPLIRRLLGQLSKLSVELLDSNLAMLQVLGSAIAKRDSDTDAHNYRVTVYAVRLAEAQHLDASEIRALIKGAFLHDVGKIGIRDDILLKPARLSSAEFEEMKRHVPHGVEIVQRARWLNNATDVVAHHHEKYDGSGYYRGLRGKDIPITARIFAIVDVFDALTSERPYKLPMSLDQALQILRDGAGQHFDPDLLALFEGMAVGLHAAFGNRDMEPRLELDLIVARYFRDDLSGVLEESVA
jgi:HD-GYP domain-containing protein (c-di-GMP phosphodiesterase class II)